MLKGKYLFTFGVRFLLEPYLSGLSLVARADGFLDSKCTYWVLEK